MLVLVSIMLNELHKGVICTCYHNNKRYEFLILESVLDYVIVLRIFEQLNKSGEADIIARNPKNNEIIEFSILGNAGKLAKKELRSTDYLIFSRYYKKVLKRYKDDVQYILLSRLVQLQRYEGLSQSKIVYQETKILENKLFAKSNRKKADGKTLYLYLEATKILFRPKKRNGCLAIEKHRL